MKIIITATLFVTLISGALTNEAESALGNTNSLTPIESTVGTTDIPNPGSGYTWTWYYTDYSLNDGWYEKWYKYKDGAGTHYMVKTYDSNGNLKGTRYY